MDAAEVGLVEGLKVRVRIALGKCILGRERILGVKNLLGEPQPRKDWKIKCYGKDGTHP